MKIIGLLIVTCLFFILFTPKKGFTQCNIQASICTPGTAGPFNFVATGGAYAGGSFAQGTCSTGSFGTHNYGFITLNITTTGALDLLVNGNTTNGFLDVIIFNIPDGTAPCDAILDPTNEIACNFASDNGGCVQIGTAFPCTASIPSPNVNAGDEIMIIVQDFSNANTSFTLDLAPGGAQTGPSDATIDPVGTTCLDAVPFQLTAANNGGTWSGPGVNASGDFDPAVAGVGTHTISYSVGTNPCDDQDQTTIEVIDCSTCLISYFDATISACVTGTGSYDVSGTVQFETPPATGDLVIEDCYGNIYVIGSPTFANPGSINYNITGLVADGSACSLTAYFIDEPTCVSGTVNYTAPTCPCNFTYLSTNISACDPTNNTFGITGSVEFENPPSTGQLIIEDCTGNQQTFNAPFTSPQNYALNGIDSDGTPNCNVTAYFSADPTCSVTSTNFNYPQTCICYADAGTYTATLTGDANSSNPYLLCYNDQLAVIGNGDFVPSQDFNVPSTYDPGVYLLAYSCPPTIFEPNDIMTDPCLLGVVSTSNQAWSIINTLGDNSTIYFVPLTMYSMVDGIYAITMSGGDRCFDLGPVFELTFLKEVTTNITENCQAGTAEVIISGGAPSFNGSNFTISNLQPATATLSTTSVPDGGSVIISGLVDGDNYSFDIVDDNGCPQTISGTFLGTEDPNFTYPNNTYCNSDPDPTATITGTPGGTFTATPAGLTIDANSGLIDLSSASGTFTITYTTPDPVCYAQQTFDITINAKPIITPLGNQTVCDQYVLPAITGADLTGNEAYYTGTGGTGVSYPAGTTLNYADFATYPVQLYIYDETGTVPNCSDEETFSLTINPTPIINPVADQIICDGYTLPPITGTNLTGSESYFTATNGGGTVLNPGTAITTQGVNTIYIYDQTATTPNCVDEETFTVTINLTPDINPVADQTECDSYTLPAITGTNLTGNEAYYDATNGGGNQYNVGNIITTTGLSTFYIFDETATTPNCFDEETFTVTINVTPIFTASYTDPTQCGVADGTITLSGLNPNTAYSVGYQNAGTAQGPSTMTSDAAGDIIISGLTPGTYSNFEVTLNGCTGVDNSSFTLTDPTSPSVDAGNDQEVCEGTAVTLTALNPDGAGITWDNGVNDGVSFTPVVGSVTYTVIANLSGCVSTDQVTVTVHPNPNVSAGNDILICEGESMILTGSGADTYVWDNSVSNGVAFTPNNTQVYTVIGTTTEGCQGTDDVEITVEPLPEVSFTADNLDGCYPVTTNFTNTSNVPGTNCTWNFGDGSTGSGCTEITHTFNYEGCFDINLEVTSANGCANDATATDYICISGYPTADFNYSPTELTTLNTEVDFENNSINANSYTWDFGDGETSTATNPTHLFPVIEDTFLVELIATNADGCTDTAYSTVQIFEELIFYVPNTFTPDEDNFNEVFKPVFTSGFDIYSYKLLIFNRWGEIIFESNDSDVGWNGTYGVGSNEIVKEGTYVWKILFKTTISDERKVEIGHVNVLK